MQLKLGLTTKVRLLYGGCLVLCAVVGREELLVKPWMVWSTSMLVNTPMDSGQHPCWSTTLATNTGARLTAYELQYDGLPATLIADSAATSLIAAGKVQAVVVGADRVAANGDTANKIGTCTLATAAAAHG